MNTTNENNPIGFDPSLAPDYVQTRLFAAGLALAKRVLQQPEGREMIDAETAARKERENALSEMRAQEEGVKDEWKNE